jgi:hypothetical protein
MTAAALACIAVLGTTAGACEDESEPQKRERAAKNKAYEFLVAQEPAKQPKYTPTRPTINFWIDTWGSSGSKGKLAYVYIQNAKGEYGYYVLVGPPVSMCTALTQTYDVMDRDGTDLVVPAPAMDGVYYSSAECNVYYGKDATTGAYVEFSIGTNQSYFLYTEPADLPVYENAQQLGGTAIN